MVYFLNIVNFVDKSIPSGMVQVAFTRVLWLSLILGQWFINFLVQGFYITLIVLTLAMPIFGPRLGLFVLTGSSSAKFWAFGCRFSGSRTQNWSPFFVTPICQNIRTLVPKYTPWMMKTSFWLIILYKFLLLWVFLYYFSFSKKHYVFLARGESVYV